MRGTPCYMNKHMNTIISTAPPAPPHRVNPPSRRNKSPMSAPALIGRTI